MVDHNKSPWHVSVKGVRGTGASNSSVIAMVVVIDIVGTLSEHVHGVEQAGALVHVEICRLNEKSGDPWVAQRFGACLWPRA